ncbi:MAG: hypothetical protein ACJ716_04425, partial [Marmoricola sp.]
MPARGLRRLAWATAAALLLSVLLAGCGSKSAPDADPGNGPVSWSSLAAVVTDHAGKPRSSKPYENRAFGPQGTGTEVDYRDGGSVTLVVGRHAWADAPDCADPPPYAPGCARVNGLVLVWAKEEPEEDPGVIHLYLEKDGAGVLLSTRGPASPATRASRTCPSTWTPW